MAGQSRQSRRVSNSNWSGPTSTSSRVIEEARKYIRVPYRVNGRSHQSGVDCVGLLILTGRDLGMHIEDHRYKTHPSQEELEQWLSEYCTRDSEIVLDEGRILQIKIPLCDGAFHTGIVGRIKGRESFIHAWDAQKFVLEPLLDNRWKQRIVATWKLNCVED